VVGEFNDLRYALSHLSRRASSLSTNTSTAAASLTFSLALPVSSVESRLQARSAPSRAALFYR
jgi:hypothetical protein